MKRLIILLDETRISVDQLNEALAMTEEMDLKATFWMAPFHNLDLYPIQIFDIPPEDLPPEDLESFKKKLIEIGVKV